MSDFNVYYLMKKYVKELFLLKLGLLCSPCWPQICYVVQAGLELTSNLPASAYPVLGFQVMCSILHQTEDLKE